jgi:MoaA/NifB/PqqE/SkfB family radical SAM enzyme
MIEIRSINAIIGILRHGTDMDVSTLARLGAKHTRNLFSEALYIHGGPDLTKPVMVYGLFNERCNVKCRQCNYWRLPTYQPEMSVEEWKRALLSVKSFLGQYFISFSGGEPFLKHGFLSILEFCRDNDIHSGVTTSGSCFTSRTTGRLTAARPFNVAVSVDAPDAGLHDYLRGIPGLFDRLTTGIQQIRREQSRSRCHFPIVIRCVVHALNLKRLPEMVAFTKKIGANSISFQPITAETEEGRGELWINSDRCSELEDVIEELLRLKRQGAPILNPDMQLKLVPAHFRNELSPVSVRPCKIGLRNLHITSNGDVKLCVEYPPIGNIRQRSAKDIWHGELAQIQRRQTVSCQMLCLAGCTAPKSFGEKIRMGLRLLERHEG